MTLFTDNDETAWKKALSGYAAAVRARGVSRLEELDLWYQGELPGLLRSRTPMHVELPELVHVTEWKMKRGTYRARNLMLVKGNDPELVKKTSVNAFALRPDARKPITILTALAGVGPATASAVLAAVNPEIYPFFDDVIAEAIPGLGKVAFTPAYYARYQERLRERAKTLPGTWNANLVGMALWSAHSE
ncbi:MAG: hypothetical protein ABIP39_02925 [Polyangiaceae bacterium]